ncbi:N-6 DNA methylase [Escherichia coli]|uniref:N-6 DNA methylase n=1 Tax=Escherichia coli TaxID=562 RepID=UPI000BE6EAE4|nr:N-6 DNA methylase [Escherichia coli]
MDFEGNVEKQINFILKSARALKISCDFSVMSDFIIVLILFKYLSESFGNYENLIKYINSTSDCDLGESSVNTYNVISEGDRWDDLLSPQYFSFDLLSDEVRFLERNVPVLEGLSQLIHINRHEFYEKSIHQLIWDIRHLDWNLKGNHKNYCGHFFEALLNSIADYSGVRSVESYTPASISKLLVRLLKPTDNMSVYDPVSGSGGTLVQVFNYFNELYNEKPLFHLFGQEINTRTSIISRINLFMHGVAQFIIKCGNSLLDPKYLVGKSGPFWSQYDKQLRKFDVVLGHPPFSVGNWGREYIECDEFRRFIYGIPPHHNGDYAFLLHMIASANEDGRIGILLPQSALFRGGSEKVIRENIIREDLIYSIIALPPGLLYGTAIPFCIIILNKKKPEGHRGKVLFIDASNNFKSSRKMNILMGSDVEKIVNTYETFSNNGTFSKIIDIEILLKNDSNINVRNYVDDSEVSKRVKDLLQHHSDFKKYSFSDPNFILSISIPKEIDNDVANVIYIHRSSVSQRLRFNLPSEVKNLKNYFRVELNPDLLLKEYAGLYFQSELGRLVLSHLPTGTSLPILSMDYVKNLQIPVPPIKMQEEVVRIANKLEITKDRISSFFSQLTTEPKQYKFIEDITGEMIYSLSSLSDEKHLKYIISAGETRYIEFKQSFFANVDKIRGEDKTIEKDLSVQYEIIKDIASFMNTEGGTLLIGVNDKGKITGVEREMSRFKFKKIDNYFQELGAQLGSRLFQDYHHYCKLTEVKVDETIVVKIDCRPTPFPVFLDNEKFHVRTDTSSPCLTGVEMLRYIQNKFK